MCIPFVVLPAVGMVLVDTETPANVLCRGSYGHRWRPPLPRLPHFQRGRRHRADQVR